MLSIAKEVVPVSSLNVVREVVPVSSLNVVRDVVPISSINVVKEVALRVVPVSSLNVAREVLPVSYLNIASGDNLRRKSGNFRYTLKIFLECAREKHGNKYNYDLIKSEDVCNNRSVVQITCLKCKWLWNQAVGSHLRGSGCPQCAGNLKWTLDRFKFKAHEIHGDKYNYDLIRPDHVRGSHSKVPIVCNACNHKWDQAISSHIGGHGCPQCAGNLRWTLDRFKLKCQELNGDKYNYDLITPDMVVNLSSEVPVFCNGCNWKWDTTVQAHTAGGGCPICVRIGKWTRDLFIRKSQIIHGNKFSYDLVAPDIKCQSSKVKLICNDCDYVFETSVVSNINAKSGCPRCSNVERWTMDKFLRVALEIHGDKFDYSQALLLGRINTRTKMPIKCKLCDYEWNPTLSTHVHKQRGCPKCAGYVSLTLEQLLYKAREIHGDKYNYDDVAINGGTCLKRIKMPITCNTCNYKWISLAKNHIHKKNGCPRCGGRVPLTLEQLLCKVLEIHGDKYNYDAVITDGNTPLKYINMSVVCNTCTHKWTVSAKNHIYKKSGCPKCKFSKGEIECHKYLTKILVDPLPQFTLKSLPRKRYDFMFVHNSEKCILEYDGEQHFNEKVTFGGKIDVDYFKKRQRIDITKTQQALNEGYKVIRIAYTEFNNIIDNIEKGIQNKAKFYCSNPGKYKYITDDIVIPQ